jgi:hypothetical protein
MCNASLSSGKAVVGSAALPMLQGIEQRPCQGFFRFCRKEIPLVGGLERNPPSLPKRVMNLAEEGTGARGTPSAKGSNGVLTEGV